jgi:dTDP-4-amino-4,6-dideoxygalactose transaminase
MPLHQQTPFEQEGDFSVSEELHRTGLCLPTGAHLNDGQVDYIIRVLRDGNYGTD